MAAAVVIVLVTAAPAYACKTDRRRDAGRKIDLTWARALVSIAGGELKASPPEPIATDLSAYEGLGSWIDIFNERPWDTPAGAVRTLAKRRARTIFLQTSTYGQSGGLFDEAAIGRFLEEAHRRDMKVVAWYVPSFAQQKTDFRRSKRAIRYESPSGHRFDSFALDIEATHVDDISLRNKRLINLSQRIRRAAGPSYPLGAITPDPIASAYWPNFPYKQVARVYDVFVPMGYFTFRASGYDDVRDYTSANIRKIRSETGQPDVPIHFIGGIADDASAHDLQGFTRAAREKKVLGASLYDYPITSRRSWYEMRALSERVAQRRRAQRREAKRAEEEKREKKSETRSGKPRGRHRHDQGAAPVGKRKATERRNPSRSPSRPDRPSADRRERERRHRHARGHRHRRS